jgi:2'-5' RNA ligase
MFYPLAFCLYNCQVNLLRTFIAIELPDEVRRYLSQSGPKLTTGIPDKAVRWVAPENMHLTLRFLGDTAETRLPDISAELDAITQQVGPFSLHLDQLGCFPNPNRPRVIWAGLAGDIQPLQAIQARIETAVNGLGWKREKRPFRPHLTLGRFRNQSRSGPVAFSQELNPLNFVVTAVNLIESRLQPTGPVYTIRHSSLLSNHD